MTNAEKFIEVMNKTFNSGLTMENLTSDCSPIILFRQDLKCADCRECNKWWDKEYVEPEEALTDV